LNHHFFDKLGLHSGHYDFTKVPIIGSGVDFGNIGSSDGKRQSAGGRTGPTASD